MSPKKNRTNENMSKWAFFSLFFCLSLVMVFFGKQASAVFVEPTAQPPENNTTGYLLIDAVDQAKSGALRLGSTSTAPNNNQLEILGQGAQISSVTADNNVKVGTTLFVDAANSKVCVGPCLGVNGAKLEVSGGSLSVAGQSTYGTYAISADKEAIYGNGTTAGVQGEAAGTANYGIWAVSTSGVALRGFSTSKSAVFGSSQAQYGIYGSNENTAGLWAGYFTGLIQSNSDVVAAKMEPTTPAPSLVPFTAGQVVNSYNVAGASNLRVKYFDGTYLWAIDDTKLYKIRASDGFQIFTVTLGTTLGTNLSDVIFDGNYIWVTAEEDNKIFKIDPTTGTWGASAGQTGCSLTLPTGEEGPRSIVFDSKYYWVILRGTNQLIKINGDCGHEDLDSSGDSLAIAMPNTPGQLQKIIYNGSYLWVLAGKIVININPSDPANASTAYRGVLSDNDETQDIFYDNYYYWVTNQSENTITKFYLGYSGYPYVLETYTTANGHGPTNMVFDGMYMWVTETTDNHLGRFVAGLASQAPQEYTLSFSPTGMVFDGTYLWLSSSTGLTKIYSGSGYGLADLSKTLTLQQNNPMVQQVGSINITGSGKVGDNTTVQGELDVTGNVWGNEASGDVIENGGNPLEANTYNCPDGHFVKNIVTDAAGEVTRIECRPL
jgi:hypothetical protein